jgi:tRNA dimethylallyltransferase
MSNPNLPLIVVVGPTAVGKTEISIHLAERLDGEIISADSRLFYRGMDVGTAKPSPWEMARLPHYLIDIVDPDETLSLSVFQKMAHLAIADIQARGKLPILVGGTGQYIRAVTQGWLPPEVKPDLRLRNELEKIALGHHAANAGGVETNGDGSKAMEGNEWLYERLKSLDPQAAQKIDARNLRRTIRALEVILTTGRKFSEQSRQAEAPYHPVTIGLNRPRAELYARIDARIDAMFQAGLLDEVWALLAKGYSSELPSMSAIGYRESVRVIAGEWSIDEAKVAMRRATRVFVRRQANWFKESDPAIQWFTVHSGVEKEIETHIREQIVALNGI